MMVILGIKYCWVSLVYRLVKRLCVCVCVRRRLEERGASLGAAADTSREFDAGLARLRDALLAISDQLDDLAIDPDEPHDQLRKIEVCPSHSLSLSPSLALTLPYNPSLPLPLFLSTSLSLHSSPSLSLPPTLSLSFSLSSSHSLSPSLSIPIICLNSNKAKYTY